MYVTAAQKSGKQLRMAWESWHSMVEIAIVLFVQVLDVCLVICMSFQDVRQGIPFVFTSFSLPYPQTPISALLSFPFSKTSSVPLKNLQSILIEMEMKS